MDQIETQQKIKTKYIPVNKLHHNTPIHRETMLA